MKDFNQRREMITSGFFQKKKKKKDTSYIEHELEVRSGDGSGGPLDNAGSGDWRGLGEEWVAM